MTGFPVEQREINKANIIGPSENLNPDSTTYATEAGAFVAVGALSDLGIGSASTVTVGGDIVAIFNVAGTVHAIDDWCLYGGASIASGKLDGQLVTSPDHGLRYDVTTGKVIGVPGLAVDVYNVKVVNGTIMIASPRPWRPAE